MRPAVFLDRDGTIIDDRGDLYSIDHVHFYDDTVPALLKLQKHFDLFIVTNQCGVSTGSITMHDVNRVNSYVTGYLAEHDITIIETYVCPHHRTDNCDCIKPKPYFLRKAERDHDIDIKNSYVIGDHPHDLEFGENVGAKGIYVLTGHGEKHRPELPEGVVIAQGIGEAAELILEQRDKK